MVLEVSGLCEAQTAPQAFERFVAGMKTFVGPQTGIPGNKKIK